MIHALRQAVGTRRGRQLTLVGVLLLSGVGGVLALELRPSVAPDTLVDRSSSIYRAGERVERAFGEQAAAVLIKGKLTKVLLTAELGRVIGLEGCLSGNAPADAEIPGGRSGPCGRLAKLGTVRAVYGPGTFTNEAARQISEGFSQRQRATEREAARAAEAAREVAAAEGRSVAEQQRLADAARQLVEVKFLSQALKTANRYGLETLPSVTDPNFVSQLVFDSRRAFGTPKARFAYLFPNSTSALIGVWLPPDLSEARRKQTLELVRQAVAMPRWHLSDATYTVAGPTLLVDSVSSDLTRSLLTLLAIAVVVMALVLLLLFGVRPRLLPLGVALCAVAITAGVLAVSGSTLTVAAIAALPILIGLSVDYAVQLRSPSSVGVRSIIVAGTASIASFLVLLLSEVPMVRGFGLMLIFGVAISLAVALVISRDSSSNSSRVLSLGSVGIRKVYARGSCHRFAGHPRGARNPAAPAPPTRRMWLGARLVRLPSRLSIITLTLGGLVAVVGFGLGSQVQVETDIAQLVPRDQPELRALERVEDATGYSGTVTVLVEGHDLATPRAMRWLRSYRARTLKRFGGASCAAGELCSGLSLTDLLPSGALTQGRIDSVLRALPDYFTRSVITTDRRTAQLSFGLRLGSIERQRGVIESLSRDLRTPAGVRATVTGLPAVAAQASGSLASGAQKLAQTGLALLAVALVLLVALRRARRVLTPLLPIVLASGWSLAVLYLLDISLNPLSATVSTLVIALATEFSVLLSERYRRELREVADPQLALGRTFSSTGRAVLVSGVTAVAGFAVLIFSDIPLLRDFGLVTVLELSVALLAVITVLPALFMLREHGPTQSQ